MMKSKPLIALTYAFTSLLLCFNSFALSTVEVTVDKKPNIIIIMADDLGWSDIGSYGGEINTPNIDELARTGLRFTQFSNTSKCFTSRASLLTGQYQHSIGLAKSSLKPLIHDVTLADILKGAGYSTLMVGKHHGVDNPYNLGFDHYSGLRDGAANHFNPGFKRKNEPEPAKKRPGSRYWCFDAECIQPYTPKNKDFYSTDAYTDWALALLKKQNDVQKPFLLYLSYAAPHDPLQP